MSKWCKKTHAATGLVSDVSKSTQTHSAAADELLAYIKRFAPTPRTALLAGNTVHADRAFLAKEPYKKVIDHLHYRILDVSSIKEAVWRWCDKGKAGSVWRGVPRKRGQHRAEGDILESIEEARYYMREVFGVAGRELTSSSLGDVMIQCISRILSVSGSRPVIYRTRNLLLEIIPLSMSMVIRAGGCSENEPNANINVLMESRVYFVLTSQSIHTSNPSSFCSRPIVTLLGTS